MVTQKYKDMLQKKSVIRTLSEFATKRGQEIGYENVFDYSLGNPSVPVVQDYTDNTIRLLQTKTSSELHGYSPRDRKSTRLNSSHTDSSRMPSSA